VFCVDDQDEPPEAHPNRKVYCSDECKKRAKNRRARKRERRAQFVRVARCEQQGKVRYRSRRAAMVALRDINSRFGGGLKYAYPCGGHWHLTSQARLTSSDTPAAREETPGTAGTAMMEGDQQEAHSP
jgi:hypothetical protein